MDTKTIELGTSAPATSLNVLYLTRVSLLMAVVLALLGLVALGPFKSLLGGLLDVGGDIQSLLLTVAAAGWVGAAIYTTLNLTLLYGPRRFAGLPPEVSRWAGARWTLLVSSLPVLILVACVCYRTPMSALNMVLGLVGGLALMTAVIALAACGQLALAEPPGRNIPHETGVLPFVIAACTKIPVIGKPLIDLFGLAYRWNPKPFQWLRRLAGGPTSGLFSLLKRVGFESGYLVRGPEPAELESGHFFALTLSVLTFLVFAAIGTGKYFYIGRPPGASAGASPFEVPSMVFLLFGLALACWLLWALTFFFDRYRVPVLVAVGTFFLVTAWLPQSDHFYPVRMSTSKLATPGQTLAAKGPRPLVVAAAGGGIQAAAWTTQVLWGIDHESKGLLRRSLAALSGVSGGSVGAMFYGAHLDDGDLRAAALEARQPSLDDVTWGLMVADMRRLLLPGFGGRLEDRGWALEQSWRARAKGLNAWLSHWAERAKAGFPAFLFNATVVESGKPYVFSTNAFPAPVFVNEDRLDWLRLGGEGAMDIPVTTAVRLSATFPVVSPAARPEIPSPTQPGRHLVDGGYYDNSGVLTLLVWLDEALEELGDARPKQVFILKILPFPPASESRFARSGWLIQLLAPAETILQVRQSSQMAQGSRQVELFRDKWKARGVEVIADDLIYTGSGQNECDEQPLSWKLTKKQRDCIDETWATGVEGGQPQNVLDYLAGASK